MVVDMKNCQDSNGKTQADLFSWIKCVHGNDWPEEQAPAATAVLAKVARVIRSKTAMQKNINKPGGKVSYDKFMNSKFELPSRRPPSQEALSVDVPTESATACASAADAHVPASEYGPLDDTSLEESKEWATMEARIKASYSRTRNLTKRLRRREHALEDAAETIEMQEANKAAGEREKEQIESQLSKTAGDLAKLKDRQHTLVRHLRNAKGMVDYWKKKAEGREASASKSKHQLEAELQSSQQESQQLSREIAEIEEAMVQLVEDAESSENATVLQTMQDGRYTDEMRTCVMSLLTHNVSTHQVGPVIKDVLQLAGYTPSDVPSVTLIRSMLLEGRAVGLVQLSDVATSGEANTLHFDGTTKEGHKYGSFQLTTDDGQYTLAVAETLSGSADHTMELLQHTISELTAAGQKLGRGQSGDKLIAGLKNTMSDRAAVNTKFTSMLQNYRSSILPVLRDDWDSLSEDQQQQMSKLNNYFCGLHLLVNLADHSGAVIKEWENSQPQPSASASDAQRQSECGTYRLIRSPCKAFERHGSEQVGQSVEFETYAKSKGINNIPLAKFRGNRFNIIFHNAAGIFYLAPTMVAYLGFCRMNRLMESVKKDLMDVRLVVGCRALGLLGKFVTAPLWRFLESEAPFSAVHGVYQEIETQLARWAEDPSELVDGTARPFQAAVIAEPDNVFDQLLVPAEHDNMVKGLLQLLTLAWHTYLHRVWEAQYVQDVPEAEETSTVPKTNVISERDFGQLDRLLRSKPNASTLAIEALIMMSNNRPLDWLSFRTQEEQTTILQVARKLVPEHRRLEKARKAAIHAYKLKKIQEQEEASQQREARRIAEVEAITQQLSKLPGGLWLTEQAIIDALAQLPTNKLKIDAIKSQLRFRKRVLCQKAEKSLFAFSRDGKNHPVAELQSNLIQLVSSTASATGTASNISDEVQALENSEDEEMPMVGAPHD